MKPMFGSEFMTIQCMKDSPGGDKLPARGRIVHVCGRLCGRAAGWDGWIHVDDEIFLYSERLISAADTALYGRVTHEMMQAYWPSTAERPGASRHDIEHSKWYNQVDKIVLSRTKNHTGDNGPEVISGNLSERINLRKRDAGNNILIFGRPSARTFSDGSGSHRRTLAVCEPDPAGNGNKNISGPKQYSCWQAKRFLRAWSPCLASLSDNNKCGATDLFCPSWSYLCSMRRSVVETLNAPDVFCNAWNTCQTFLRSEGCWFFRTEVYVDKLIIIQIFFYFLILVSIFTAESSHRWAIEI